MRFRDASIPVQFGWSSPFDRWQTAFADLDAVTIHNPFAVNDVWFAHETGFDVARTNQRGSSLIFGHPNGPTGARLLVEFPHARGPGRRCGAGHRVRRR